MCKSIATPHHQPTNYASIGDRAAEISIPPRQFGQTPWPADTSHNCNGQTDIAQVHHENTHKQTVRVCITAIGNKWMKMDRHIIGNWCKSNFLIIWSIIIDRWNPSAIGSAKSNHHLTNQRKNSITGKKTMQDKPHNVSAMMLTYGRLQRSALARNKSTRQTINQHYWYCGHKINFTVKVDLLTIELGIKIISIRFDDLLVIF